MHGLANAGRDRHGRFMTVDVHGPEAERPSPPVPAKPLATPLAKKKGGLAVASALLVTLLVTARLVHVPTDGSLTAAERTTLAIDDRLGLVVEKGAALTWSRDLRGNLTVHVERGRAFVRVSSGTLALSTPALTLRTTMGAFSVDATALETRVVVHEGHATASARAATAATPSRSLVAGATLRAGVDGALEVASAD